MTQMARIAIGMVLLAVVAHAQASVREVLQRHGVSLPDRGVEGAFDAGAVVSVPVAPGALAGPLALLTTATGRDRVEAAYAFGILAGRSGRAAAPAERAAAGAVLVQLVQSADRRDRIAGARVAGRVFAVPLDADPAPAAPQGLPEALFALLNASNETEQLAAMDALGLVRERTAVIALTERYHFHRDRRKRALAGGALEALARIGDPSSADLARGLATDTWAEGADATALAAAFARERLLQDGSIAVIRQALADQDRRVQAEGYLAELGASAP